MAAMQAQRPDVDEAPEHGMLPGVQRGATAARRAFSVRWLFPAFCFAFPVFYHLWPVLGQLNKAVLVDFIDIAPNLWSLWHVSEWASLHGDSLYYTHSLMAPVGANLVFHSLCFLPCLLVTPLVKIFGVFAGYNALIVLGILCAGLGAWLLVRHLTGSGTAGSFAALAVEMSPLLYYRVINHFSLVFMGLICVNAYMVLAVLLERNRGSRLKRASLTAAVLFATFLTDYNLLIYSIICMACLFLTCVWRRPAVDAGTWKSAVGDRWLTALLSGGLFTLAVGAWVALMMPFGDARQLQDGYDPQVAYQLRADAGFFLVPNPNLSAWGERLSAWLRLPYLPGGEQSTYFGYAALLLALVGAFHLFSNIRNRVAAVGILGLVLLFLNLSLGKEIAFLMSPCPVKGLNRLLLLNYVGGFTLFEHSRVPGRWAMPCFLMLAALAGCGFHRLLQLRRPWMKYGTTGLVVLLVLTEYAHVPSRIGAFPLPKAYEAIGTAPRPDATIVEVPVGYMDGMGIWGDMKANVDRMIWGTQHHYRMVSCYLSRVGERRAAQVFNQPLLRDIWLCQGNESGFVSDGTPTPSGKIEAWLNENHVAYVIVRKGPPSAVVERYLASTGLFTPIERDGDYAVFRFREFGNERRSD